MSKRKPENELPNKAVLHYRIKGDRKMTSVRGVTATTELGERLSLDTDHYYFQGTFKGTKLHNKQPTFSNWPLPAKWLAVNQPKQKGKQK